MVTPTRAVSTVKFAHFELEGTVKQNRILIQNIFKFIDSREINTLSRTSHSWRQLIFEKKFFLKNHVSFLHGNAQDFPSATYYLFGTNQENKICKALLRELILEFSVDYFVIVLFEGFPSTKHGTFHPCECFLNLIKDVVGVEKFTLPKTRELPGDAYLPDSFFRDNSKKIGMGFSGWDVQPIENMDNRPRRIQSLIDTLNHVENAYIKQTEARILDSVRIQNPAVNIKVIIKCSPEHLKSTKCDLQPLYQTLGKLKSVAMIPSILLKQ